MIKIILWMIFGGLFAMLASLLCFLLGILAGTVYVGFLWAVRMMS